MPEAALCPGTMASDATELPLDRLRTYLEEHGIALANVAADRIGGGKPNPTYRLAVEIAVEPNAGALRCPPLGQVLATAHDIGREFWPTGEEPGGVDLVVPYAIERGRTALASDERSVR